MLSLLTAVMISVGLLLFVTRDIPALAYAFSVLLVIREGGLMAGYGGEQANHYGSLYGLSGIRRPGLNRKCGGGYPVWFGPVRLDPRYLAAQCALVELRHAERDGDDFDQ